MRNPNKFRTFLWKYSQVPRMEKKIFATDVARNACFCQYSKGMGGRFTGTLDEAVAHFEKCLAEFQKASA